MKINNKGFMLVEIVVVTVVVVTIMTSLYIVFNRVYTAFERKSSYSDVDAIYALDLIKDYLIETEIVYNDGTSSFLYNDLFGYIKSSETDGYIEIKKGMFSEEGNNMNFKIKNETSFNEYINKVFDNYNVSKVYLVSPYSEKVSEESPGKTPIKKLYEEENINQTFKEYIEYLNKAVNPFKSDDIASHCTYDEILIIETYSEEDSENKNISNKYAYLNRGSFSCIN